MNAKKIYRRLIAYLEYIPAKVTTAKVWLMEWYAILCKANMYSNIKWTREQKIEFNTYWIENYGKKISPRWHKLYQSINGIFNVAYIPEIIYTTKLEPKGNNYLYAKVLADKNLVDLLVDGENVVSPRTIISCCKGKLRTGDYKLVSEKEAENLLQEYSVVVVKPTVGGSSGNGVELVNLQKNETNIQKWRKQYNSNFIVQEAVIQHEALAKIYPYAVNTIRLITYLIDDEVCVAPICLRIGQGGKQVDNIHAGGLSVYIREDGKLNNIAYELGYCNKKVKYYSHPDTNIIFENYGIPYVDKMVSEAKKLHLKLPHIKFVSWDFTINNQDQIVLIEVNLSGQGIWFPQIASGKQVFEIKGLK